MRSASFPVGEFPTTTSLPERLINHLAGAIQRATRMANEAVLHLDGSLAAAVLAGVARDQCDIPLLLVSLRRPGESPSAARRVAQRLNLSLVERVLSAADVEATHNAAAPRDVPPPLAQTLAQFHLAAHEAHRYGPRFLLPTGADLLTPPVPEVDAAAAIDQELRTLEGTWLPAFARLAEPLRLELRYPILDRGVLPFLKRVLSEMEPPGPGEPTWLEQAARRLGLPAAAQEDKPPTIPPTN